jgi:hypothetical protein
MVKLWHVAALYRRPFSVSRVPSVSCKSGFVDADKGPSAVDGVSFLELGKKAG